MINLQPYNPNSSWPYVFTGSLAALRSNLPKQPLTSHPSVKSQLDKGKQPPPSPLLSYHIIFSYFTEPLILLDFTYSDDPVVVSGTLVTSRGPGTTFPFALTLVEKLCGKEKRVEITAPMVFPLGTFV